MTGDARALSSAERKELEDAIVAGATPDHLVVRALIALGAEPPERLARSTAMDREFIAAVRGYVDAGRIAALMERRMNASERLLETATARLVAGGGELSIAEVARDAGIARRTLHRRYTAPELIVACRRRAMTVWRTRFVHRVLAGDGAPEHRLFRTVDVLAEWVASERFRAEFALWTALSNTPQGDDLRDHLEAIATFAERLAQHSGLGDPAGFGAFVATSAAGASAWFDRRDAARAAANAYVTFTLRATQLP